MECHPTKLFHYKEANSFYRFCITNFHEDLLKEFFFLLRVNCKSGKDILEKKLLKTSL